MAWYSEINTLNLQEGDTRKHICILLSTICFRTYNRNKVIIKL
jgi:hypothetical protein